MNNYAPIRRLTETPIIADMRRTARELGIVDLLLQHQRIREDDWHTTEAYALVEEALVWLGVTPDQLTENAAKGEPS